MKNSSQAFSPSSSYCSKVKHAIMMTTELFAGILKVPASDEHVDLECWAGAFWLAEQGSTVMTGFDTSKERSCLKVQRQTEGLVADARDRDLVSPEKGNMPVTCL